ncbi:hypothetical protein [Microbacterium sp. LWH10-1.2]|uniref:hypothetical protein n=1 Tax=Microbacterium sp. LWH10-1.2 TaxID=3135255 RepID=UPI00313A25B5
MNSLLIRPHFAYVSRWDDLSRQFDTPDAAAFVSTSGPLYSAFLERTTPRQILEGITIVDYDHGVLYEVIAERRNGVPTLLRKTVAPYGRDTLNDAAQLHDGFLATVAVDYLENDAPKTPLGAVEREVEPENRPRTTRPSLERIAKFARDQQALYDAAQAAGASRQELTKLAARHALAKAFHVHVQTADVWLRQAREAKLLPAAKVGRPKKDKS